MTMLILRKRLLSFFRSPFGLLVVCMLAFSVMTFSTHSTKVDHHDDNISVKVASIDGTGNLSDSDLPVGSSDDSTSHIHDLCHNVMAMPVHGTDIIHHAVSSTPPIDTGTDLLISSPQYPPYRPPIA